jgi:quercetin dioxygenase-like cupin family protein
MHMRRTWLVGAGLFGAALFGFSGLMQPAQSANTSPAVQNHKPMKINRLYTGPDGQTHVEEIEAKFASEASGNDIYKLLANANAEIHRAPPGRVADWHTAPRRQYVVTLSGHGEIELMGGKKIQVGPGSIELAEDLTGKGHITRTVGNEDRVTIQIPLSDR